MKRRVGVAQAVLGDPELVVLDEPTAGLDPEQRLRFRDLVSRIGEGRSLFAGTPAALIELAAGRVWLDAERSPTARLAWRNGNGLVRNIGEAPAGAELAAPTLEDAYLLLVGDRAMAVTA